MSATQPRVSGGGQVALGRWFEVKSDESQHPTPTPEDGKALIYVVADGHLTTIFGFDEKWVGAVSS